MVRASISEIFFLEQVTENQVLFTGQLQNVKW